MLSVAQVERKCLLLPRVCFNPPQHKGGLGRQRRVAGPGYRVPLYKGARASLATGALKQTMQVREGGGSR
eukprot:601470-Rhodomonas_salina.4